MKKMIEWLKNNLLVICITLILGISINTMAEVVVPSAGVSYSNSKTSETTVNGALDELFEAVKINEEIATMKTQINNLENSTAISKLINTMYPIGSIYISTKNTDPGTIFTGTTWTSFGTGRTLVGVNTSNTNFNTVEKTGGASSVKLTTAQLPSHYHGIPVLSGTAAKTGSGYTISYGSSSRETDEKGAHYHGVYSIGFSLYAIENGFVTPVLGAASFNTDLIENATSTAGGHKHSVTEYYANKITGVENHGHTVTTVANNTEPTGSGTAVSVQDPYITVYMWKRTA